MCSRALLIASGALVLAACSTMNKPMLDKYM